MARRKTADQLIRELEKKYRLEIAAEYVAAISNISDSVILKDLTAAIGSGQIERALQIIGVEIASFRNVELKMLEAFESGGSAVASTLPRTRPTPANPVGASSVFRFDFRIPSAEKWLADHSSQLVTRLSEASRMSVRQSLETGLIEGRNPRNVALDIVGRINPATGRRTGGVIGLNGPQERFVKNAVDELLTGERDLSGYLTRKLRDKRFDSYVFKALETGEPIPKEIAEKMIGRYKDNLLLLRGETIGRSEAIETLNRSQMLAYSQAVDKGSIKEVEKIWDSTGDRVTREDHQELDGVSVGIDEPFVDGIGSLMLHPGDTSLGAAAESTINCRCRARYNVNFFAGLTEES